MSATGGSAGDGGNRTDVPWVVQSRDLEAVARELDAFVPERVFDAHVHLWESPGDWAAGPGQHPSGPDRAGMAQFRSQMAELLPGRAFGAIAMGSAYHHNRESYNRFVGREVAAETDLHGHLCVPPGMDPDELRATVRSLGLRGLKVYHWFASQKPTFNAEIWEYLPDEYMQVCNEERWSITLHIVRPRALSDTKNQEWLQRAAANYPGAKIILAHAGRGFNGYHTVYGIDALSGLKNVWYDAAAVTESLALEAIIDVAGPERLLWGSDYPVSHMRGRVVTIGDDFVWLDAAAIDFAKFNAHGVISPYLLIIESLRALRTAARSTRLSDSQIQGIFWDNAQAMMAR